MKQLLYSGLLICILGFLSCQSETKTSPTSQPSPTTSETNLPTVSDDGKLHHGLEGRICYEAMAAGHLNKALVDYYEGGMSGIITTYNGDVMVEGEFSASSRFEEWIGNFTYTMNGKDYRESVLIGALPEYFTIARSGKAIVDDQQVPVAEATSFVLRAVPCD